MHAKWRYLKEKSVSQVKSEKIYYINDDKKIVYMRAQSQPKRFFFVFHSVCVCDTQQSYFIARCFLFKEKKHSFEAHGFKYQIVRKLYGNRNLRSEYGLIVINKCKLYFRFLIGTPK